MVLVLSLCSDESGSREVERNALEEKLMPVG
jgi:hypothetical protein